ncbi:MAG: hypothetical protein HDT43_00590 [Ruminococcaceae bacterium]|nr:hypothetical protein [Oscillospiraceae bacterium]
MRRFFEEHKLENDGLSEERIGMIRTSVLSRAEEVKPMKKRKFLKPLIIAAAAAAVLLLTGFEVVYRNEIRFGSGKVFDINYIVQSQATIPEKYKVYSDDLWENNDNIYNKKPSEVLEMFNLPSIINDNFIELEETGTYYQYNDNKVASMQIAYDLIDKETGQMVWVSMSVALDESAAARGTYEGFDDKDFQFVTLNDGSTGVIFQEHTAHFVYDGIYYYLLLEPEAPYMENVTIMDIMNSLGVLEKV